MKQTGTFFTSKINVHFLNNKSLLKGTFTSGLDEWFPECCQSPNYMPPLTTKVDPVSDESRRLCQSAASHQVQATLHISILSSLKAMFSGNHEPWVLLPQFPSLYLLWTYLEDQDCLSRRKRTKRFTDGTFLHTHALCLIFKCALQENISARGQAPFFGKGKFECFKLIAHSSKDQKKKEDVIHG